MDCLYLFCPVGRAYTLSVALPGSIIANAQTAELRTSLAGQVARALVIFNVDEVVVFDEKTTSAMCVQWSIPASFLLLEFFSLKFSPLKSCLLCILECRKERGRQQQEDPNLFLGRILDYLETPQSVAMCSGVL